MMWSSFVPSSQWDLRIQVVRLPKQIDVLRNSAPVSWRHSNVGLIEDMVEGEIFHGDVHLVNCLFMVWLEAPSLVVCIAEAMGHLNTIRIVVRVIRINGIQAQLLLSTSQMFHNKVDDTLRDVPRYCELTGVLLTFHCTLPVTTSCHMTCGIHLILPSESFRLSNSQWIAEATDFCGEIQIQKISVD